MRRNQKNFNVNEIMQKDYLLIIVVKISTLKRLPVTHPVDHIYTQVKNDVIQDEIDNLIGNI